MKIVNWNTWGDKVQPGASRFAQARELIASFDADVICLTEAFPQSMPDGGQTITSEVSGWKCLTKPEEKGARKVVLWSCFGWTAIDTFGSAKLPEGRFVRATTECNGSEFSFVGMCIPYQGYRKRNWQGACEYLDALRTVVLSKPRFKRRTVLLGDFNLQIPPHGRPGKNTEINRKREATFDGWPIPTAGEWEDPALDRRFIDHVAYSPDLKARSMRFFSRIAVDDAELSDHNGVCLEIETG